MLLNEIFQKHPDEKTAFIFKDEGLGDVFTGSGC